MSTVEGMFCRSLPWRFVARRAALPWALDGHALAGEVLEIGGGSGAMAAGVADRFPGVRLTVTDADTRMVESARAVLAAYSHVEVRVADVTALPFADETFAVVTSYLMLHHVVEWPTAVSEIGRVLEPRGVLLGYDLTDTRLARWVHRVDGSPHRLVAPVNLRQALVAEGFTDVEVRPAAGAHLMRFRARGPATPA